MFGLGKKKEKDLPEGTVIYDIDKVYIGGIPGHLDGKGALAHAERVIGPLYPDIPILPSFGITYGEHEKKRDGLDSWIDLMVDSRRVTLQDDGKQKVEWIVLAGVMKKVKVDPK